MPTYSTADIRNVALVGHSGAGKTSIAEALLHMTGATSRLGSVADGSSHLDYTDEEKERGGSLDSSLCSLTVDGVCVNIVDTPGTPDFVGPAIASLAGVETAICVIPAASGIEVNTRRMMQKAEEAGLGRVIVINKIDADNINLPELLSAIQETFGSACLPVNLPADGGNAVISCFGGAGSSDMGDLGEARTSVIEAIAESDEALMEKYFEHGDLDDAEAMAAMPVAIASGSLIPVVFSAATKEVGVQELMALIIKGTANPIQGKARMQADHDKPITADPAGPLVGQVFKVVTDPRSNIKFSVIRLHSGTLKHDTGIHINDDRRAQRPGGLQKLQGGEHVDLDAGIAGDIVAVAKLDLSIGDVVHAGSPGAIEMPSFPDPMFSLAIEPKSRGDVEKVSGALSKFTDEDPCLKADRDHSTAELIIRGIGDQHLRTVLGKMAKYFKLEVNTKAPKIPYRETIMGRAENVEYTHKKQTGGAGQFARIFITVEPNERGAGYEFIDKIFGGSIDQQFRPSVDKGVHAQLNEGILAGYPVVDVKVSLVDGKTHPVDSKDIAFQIAGREAIKIAFQKAKPALLEPIVNIEVTAPSANVGDLQGDIASRRGRPQGQEMLPGGMAVIKAQVPLSEVADYSSRLSSITGGQGSYAMELSHYEQVPPNVQQQIVDAAKKAKEEG